MLLLTALFGYSYLTDTVMSSVFLGIMLGVWLLVVDFAFSPRQEDERSLLPSRVNSIDASSNKRVFIVLLLSLWFLLLIAFSLWMLF